MNITLRLVVASAAILAASPCFAARGSAFLPTQQAVAAVADGVPWSAASPNGRNFKLTLNKDGTGSLQGGLPFSLSVTWMVKDDAMCLSSTMMSKCLRFREVPGGFQAWEGDKPDLKLSR